MAKSLSRHFIFKSTATPSPYPIWSTFTTKATTEEVAAASAVPRMAIKDKKQLEDSLFHRVVSLRVADAAEDADKIVATLDNWVKEGKPVKRFDFVSLISYYRRANNLQPALQVKIHEWMEKNFEKRNNADRARYIDLLGRTSGLTSAENYFERLERSAKTKKTYGALLNCYCREKMLDKATELFEKIKELDFATALSYHNMMSLYLSIGQPEKVPLLAKEMGEKNIEADIYIYNNFLNCHASLKDLDAMKRVLEEMKAKKVKFDWFTYGNLATIYVKSGLLDEANAVLEKMEQMKNLRDREAFNTLISLYGKTGNLSAVNRVWELLKSTFETPSNLNYLIMLLALSKLGDVDGLEKCFIEWESACSIYDVRLYNVLLESYLERDMVSEAELLYDKMEKTGTEPNLRTLDVLSNFYIKNGKIDMSLKYLDMGVSKAKPGKHDWFPSDETIRMFLKYFEDENDVERAELFCKSMKQINRLDNSVYDSLLQTKIAA